MKAKKVIFISERQTETETESVSIAAIETEFIPTIQETVFDELWNDTHFNAGQEKVIPYVFKKKYPNLLELGKDFTPYIHICNKFYIKIKKTNTGFILTYHKDKKCETESITYDVVAKDKVENIWIVQRKNYKKNSKKYLNKPSAITNTKKRVFHGQFNREIQRELFTKWWNDETFKKGEERIVPYYFTSQYPRIGDIQRKFPNQVKPNERIYIRTLKTKDGFMLKLYLNKECRSQYIGYNDIYLDEETDQWKTMRKLTKESKSKNTDEDKIKITEYIKFSGYDLQIEVFEKYYNDLKVGEKEKVPYSICSTFPYILKERRKLYWLTKNWNIYLFFERAEDGIVITYHKNKNCLDEAIRKDKAEFDSKNKIWKLQKDINGLPLHAAKTTKITEKKKGGIPTFITDIDFYTELQLEEFNNAYNDLEIGDEKILQYVIKKQYPSILKAKRDFSMHFKKNEVIYIKLKRIKHGLRLSYHAKPSCTDKPKTIDEIFIYKGDWILAKKWAQNVTSKRILDIVKGKKYYFEFSQEEIRLISNKNRLKLMRNGFNEIVSYEFYKNMIREIFANDFKNQEEKEILENIIDNYPEYIAEEIFPINDDIPTYRITINMRDIPIQEKVRYEGNDYIVKIVRFYTSKETAEKNSKIKKILFDNDIPISNQEKIIKLSTLNNNERDSVLLLPQQAIEINENRGYMIVDNLPSICRPLMPFLNDKRIGGLEKENILEQLEEINKKIFTINTNIVGNNQILWHTLKNHQHHNEIEKCIHNMAASLNYDIWGTIYDGINAKNIFVTWDVNEETAKKFKRKYRPIIIVEGEMRKGIQEERNIQLYMNTVANKYMHMTRKEKENISFLSLIKKISQLIAIESKIDEEIKRIEGYIHNNKYREEVINNCIKVQCKEIKYLLKRLIREIDISKHLLIEASKNKTNEGGIINQYLIEPIRESYSEHKNKLLQFENTLILCHWSPEYKETTDEKNLDKKKIIDSLMTFNSREERRIGRLLMEYGLISNLHKGINYIIPYFNREVRDILNFRFRVEGNFNSYFIVEYRPLEIDMLNEPEKTQEIQENTQDDKKLYKLLLKSIYDLPKIHNIKKFLKYRNDYYVRLTNNTELFDRLIWPVLFEGSGVNRRKKYEEFKYIRKQINEELIRFDQYFIYDF
ncbi:hypothetical protein ACFL56_01410 [Candidatus Margulisiibacteriota bacterium]